MKQLHGFDELRNEQPRGDSEPHCEDKHNNGMVSLHFSAASFGFDFF
jgi:hypothetical protein